MNNHTNNKIKEDKNQQPKNNDAEVTPEETQKVEASGNEMNKTEKELEKLRADLNEKDVALLAMEQERNDWKEKFMRKMAEFDNYKRRTDQEQQNIMKYAGEKLVGKLLPVIDDFERSIQHITEESDVKTLQQGVQLIYEKFMKFLNDQGIKRIDVVGKPFDVHYHDALYQQPSEIHPPHTVIQEVQAGYTYKDRVLRHAQVIVAAEQENAVAEETNPSEEN